jgi:hypothetical protein
MICEFDVAQGMAVRNSYSEYIGISRIFGS